MSAARPRIIAGAKSPRRRSAVRSLARCWEPPGLVGGEVADEAGCCCADGGAVESCAIQAPPRITAAEETRPAIQEMRPFNRRYRPGAARRRTRRDTPSQTRVCGRFDLLPSGLLPSAP